MKKILSFIVALAMLCTVFVGSAYAADCLTFTLSSATAQPGETVTLTMEISNNPGITALGVSIAYPSELSLADKATDAKLFGANGASTVPPATNNPYKYIWSEDYSDFDANGVLYTIPVKVSEDAAPGEYEIVVTIPAESTYNADFDEVEVVTVNGIITVAAPGPVVPTAEDLGLVTDAQVARISENVMTNNGYAINKALVFKSAIYANAAVDACGTVITCEDRQGELVIPVKDSGEVDNNVKTFYAAVTSIRDINLDKTFTAKAYADVTVGESKARVYAEDAATAVYND